MSSRSGGFAGYAATVSIRSRAKTEEDQTYVKIRDLKLIDIRDQSIVSTHIGIVSPVVVPSGLVTRLAAIGVSGSDFLQVIGPFLDVFGRECAAIGTAGAVVEDTVVVDGDLAVGLEAKDLVILRVAEGDFGAGFEKTVCYGLLGSDVSVGFVDALARGEVTALLSKLVA